MSAQAWHPVAASGAQPARHACQSCLSPRGFSTPAPNHRCRAALESGGSGLQVEEVILPDGEEHKSIEVLQQARSRHACRMRFTQLR